MIKMNPEVKELWLKALRSGDYKQGTGRLCTVVPVGPYEAEWTERRYCCLGVLTDLGVQNGVIDPTDVEEHKTVDGVVLSYPTDSGRESVGTPPAIREWANIDYFGSLGDFAAKRDLADMNDSGMTFAEIADAIEKCL